MGGCRRGAPVSLAHLMALDSMLRKLSMPDRAAPFAGLVANALGALGATVLREVIVPRRGDGQRGRVDLVASWPESGLQMAVECDNKSPRAKSITKLKQMPADVRLIVLRTPKPMHQLPDGIWVCGVEVTP